MGKWFKKAWDTIKRKPIATVACFLLVAICVVSLWAVSVSRHMSVAPMTPVVRFEGEYKIADGDWKQIEEDMRIPATDGDVTLKGNFVLSLPDGELMTDNPEGWTLHFYFNHLSATITVGGEEWLFDVEHPQVGEEACGVAWSAYAFPTSADGVAEITFSNPHTYGNETAVEDFLHNLRADPPTLLTQNLALENDFLRYVGFAFMAMALVLCSCATVSSILKVQASKMLWALSGWMFFAGGFYVMDLPDVFLWSGKALFNTTALALCQMLSVFFLGLFIIGFLKKTEKTVAVWAYFALGVFLTVITVLSALKVIRIYDVALVWQIVQALVLAILTACLLLNRKRQNKGMRWVLYTCLACAWAVLINIVGRSLGLWHSLVFTKIIFGGMFVFVVCFGIYTVITNYQASIRSKEMEAELKDKSIAVMISQIQPHFLYNTLNGIAELCVVDSKRAEKATIDFSRYLRGNMGALNEKKTIEFEDELNHLNHYIALEKMRYGDDLEFVYDIKEKAFTLPALTVQPLVENAVNHGIRYHKMKGKIKISTDADERNFYVVIEDDGVGFDPEKLPLDAKKHVGIANVKYRLGVMCGGSVSIESEKGKGTKVTIVIPREKQP